MDERRVGRCLRVLRRARRWRQVDLAARAGVTQSTVSDIEGGRWTRLQMATLRRVFAATDADFDCEVRYRGAGLDRLLDERHAATAAAVATHLQSRGWAVTAEVSFNHFGDRGSIDLMAHHPASRTVLVVEVKSEIASVEETLRRHDIKCRLAPALAQERYGEQPARVVRLLAVTDSTANRNRVARLDSLFGPAYPLRASELRRWLNAPGPATGGLLFIQPTRDIAGGDRMRGSHRMRRAESERSPQSERGERGQRQPGVLDTALPPTYHRPGR